MQSASLSGFSTSLELLSFLVSSGAVRLYRLFGLSDWFGLSGSFGLSRLSSLFGRFGLFRDFGFFGLDCLLLAAYCSLKSLCRVPAWGLLPAACCSLLTIAIRY